MDHLLTWWMAVTLQCHQTWRVGKWIIEIEINDVPMKTFIHGDFFIAMLDYQGVPKIGRLQHKKIMQNQLQGLIPGRGPTEQHIMGLCKCLKWPDGSLISFTAINVHVPVIFYNVVPPR